MKPRSPKLNSILSAILHERRYTGRCDRHEIDLESATPKSTSLQCNFAPVFGSPKLHSILLDTPAFHWPRQPHARTTNSNQNYHPHCCRREAGSTKAEHYIAVEPIATSFVTASIDFASLQRHIVTKLITICSDLSVLVIKLTASRPGRSHTPLTGH